MVRKEQKTKFRPFSRLLVGKNRAHTGFWYKFAVVISLIIYRLLYRLKVYGLENYPIGEPALITPNHISFLDPPIVGCTCPEEVWAVGQDYLFKAPILGSLMRRINTLPVTNSAYDKGVIKKIISLLRRGKKVVIFPEGKRSFSGEIEEFKRGIGLLASQAKCKLIPVIIEGPFEAFPRQNKYPKFWGHKFSIYFGKPLDWKDYEEKYSSNKEAQKMLIIDLRETMIKLQKEFREVLRKEGRLYSRLNSK